MKGRDVVGLLAISLAIGAFAVGCGASSSPTTTGTPSTAVSPAPAPSTTTSTPATAPAAPSSGALTPEAQAAATGDVPDNQVFLTFSNGRAGYSMKYPEGWAQRGAGSLVTFKDKNNLVRIVVSPGTPPSIASVTAAMKRLATSTPSLRFVAPTSAALLGRPAVKVVYSTRGDPNPVTGKRVYLVVDRYYLFRAGHVAVVDLGTPKGVDNVDAYRLMIGSFRWR